MKELSLNILDIAMNSVKAKAKNIFISIKETESVLKIEIKDDGCGMTKDVLSSVTDPFCTTRTTRKVGLGIPFYKLAAEQTGGTLEITSQTDAPSGTTVTATFFKDHIDCLPLGDVVSTLVTLIQGSPDIDFIFSHNFVSLDTRQIRQILQNVPLSSPEVLSWIRDYLFEQYKENKMKI